MGAKAQAIEAGQFGVDETLLRHFVPMNGLAPAHICQLVPFAGVSELHPGDSVPTNFKTSDQAYYVVQGQLDLYAGSELAGTVRGSTEEVLKLVGTLSPGCTIGLFALDGRSWRYPLRVTPNASLVDMEALPDGRLMMLERGYGLMFFPMIISLRYTRISADNAGERLPVTTLAVLDSSRGWSVDNFEGLARHRGLKFFMVSDDNFNALQKTLLVYFEPTGVGDPGKDGNSSEFELRQENPD